MTGGKLHCSGMPYVPGIVRGELRRGPQGAAEGRVVVLDAADIGTLTAYPCGLVLVDAAPLAHATIALLGSGIPTVIVTAAQAATLREGVEVTLDGARGLVTEGAVAEPVPPLVPAITTTSPCLTADGSAVHLRVSARDAIAAQHALLFGAEALGLVRAEFLQPAGGRMPDAEFYRQAFGALCDAAAPLPVTIRLADFGADKRPGWLPARDGVGGALGLQGVRLFDSEPVRCVYLAQLAALDELATQYPLRLLLPYIANRDELQRWVGDVRRRMRHTLPLGAMAETPAAVLQMTDWLEQVDFVAVGCNDLMQCFFGASRDNPTLRGYLDPFSPALFGFLRQAAGAARAQRHRVQLCGVLPQLPGVLPVLLGLGYRVFSVEAMLLGYLRRSIASVDIDEARALARRVCEARDSLQVRAMLTAQAPAATAPLRQPAGGAAGVDGDSGYRH